MAPGMAASEEVVVKARRAGSLMVRRNSTTGMRASLAMGRRTRRQNAKRAP